MGTGFRAILVYLAWCLLAPGSVATQRRQRYDEGPGYPWVRYQEAATRATPVYGVDVSGRNISQRGPSAHHPACTELHPQGRGQGEEDPGRQGEAHTNVEDLGGRHEGRVAQGEEAIRSRVRETRERGCGVPAGSGGCSLQPASCLRRLLQQRCSCDQGHGSGRRRQQRGVGSDDGGLEPGSPAGLGQCPTTGVRRQHTGETTTAPANPTTTTTADCADTRTWTFGSCPVTCVPWGPPGSSIIGGHLRPVSGHVGWCEPCSGASIWCSSSWIDATDFDQWPQLGGTCSDASGLDPASTRAWIWAQSDSRETESTTRLGAFWRKANAIGARPGLGVSGYRAEGGSSRRRSGRVVRGRWPSSSCHRDWRDAWRLLSCRCDSGEPRLHFRWSCTLSGPGALEASLGKPPVPLSPPGEYMVMGFSAGAHPGIAWSHPASLSLSLFLRGHSSQSSEGDFLAEHGTEAHWVLEYFQSRCSVSSAMAFDCLLGGLKTVAPPSPLPSLGLGPGTPASLYLIFMPWIWGRSSVTSPFCAWLLPRTSFAQPVSIARARNSGIGRSGATALLRDTWPFAVLYPPPPKGVSASPFMVLLVHWGSSSDQHMRPDVHGRAGHAAMDGPLCQQPAQGQTSSTGAQNSGIGRSGATALSRGLHFLWAHLHAAIPVLFLFALPGACGLSPMGAKRLLQKPMGDYHADLRGLWAFRRDGWHRIGVVMESHLCLPSVAASSRGAALAFLAILLLAQHGNGPNIAWFELHAGTFWIGFHGIMLSCLMRCLMRQLQFNRSPGGRFLLATAASMSETMPLAFRSAGVNATEVACRRVRTRGIRGSNSEGCNLSRHFKRLWLFLLYGLAIPVPVSAGPPGLTTGLWLLLT